MLCFLCAGVVCVWRVRVPQLTPWAVCAHGAARVCLQVQGKDRARVAAVAEALKLCDYIPRSYIEQVCVD